jgi:hypothetical protein
LPQTAARPTIAATISSIENPKNRSLLMVLKAAPLSDSNTSLVGRVM